MRMRQVSHRQVRNLVSTQQRVRGMPQGGRSVDEMILGFAVCGGTIWIRIWRDGVSARTNMETALPDGGSRPEGWP